VAQPDGDEVADGSRGVSVATRAGTLSTEAYGRLRQLIITCELAPGERVTEAQLVSTLGMGKTPVREALTRLAQHGLVRSIPGHGYQIAPVTLQDVRDLFGLRLILEPAAMELAAARITDEQIERLAALHGRGGDVAELDAAELRRTNAAFHHLIIEAAGNSRLLVLVDQVLAESERFVYLGLFHHDRMNEIRDEHGQMVEAMRAHDSAGARELAERHLERSQAAVFNAVMANPSLQQTPLFG
jgi:DNA-binding GntR family transcriptional regulator